MSGKKTMGWRSILLGLAAAMAVDLLGVLLVTLLTVRGAVGEGSGLPLLAGGCPLCGIYRRNDRRRRRSGASLPVPPGITPRASPSPRRGWA